MKIYDASVMANTLLRKHGLFDLGWDFEYDYSKKRAGVCFYGQKVIRLSIHFVQLNDPEEIRDTILHEIAHALVGFKHGHDNVWKRKCVEIGAKPNRCYDSTSIKMPKGKWVGTCPNCNTDFYMHRKPKRLLRRHVACGSSGVFRLVKVEV